MEKSISKNKKKPKTSNKKKSGRFMKVVVAAMIVSILIFTAIILVIFYRNGNEPATLVKCFFVYFSFEGSGMALIRISENKWPEPKDEYGNSITDDSAESDAAAKETINDAVPSSTSSDEADDTEPQ